MEVTQLAFKEHIGGQCRQSKHTERTRILICERENRTLKSAMLDDRRSSSRIVPVTCEAENRSLKQDHDRKYHTRVSKVPHHLCCIVTIPDRQPGKRKEQSITK